MRILHLPIKGKWFDMILALIKKKEYRQIKGYWTKRLYDSAGEPIPYDIVRFINGYSRTSRQMDVEYKGVDIEEPVPEWSDNAQGRHYAISLGKIISTKNLKAPTA